MGGTPTGGRSTPGRRGGPRRRHQSTKSEETGLSPRPPAPSPSVTQVDNFTSPSPSRGFPLRCFYLCVVSTPAQTVSGHRDLRNPPHPDSVRRTVRSFVLRDRDPNTGIPTSLVSGGISPRTGRSSGRGRGRWSDRKELRIEVGLGVSTRWDYWSFPSGREEVEGGEWAGSGLLLTPHSHRRLGQSRGPDFGVFTTRSWVRRGQTGCTEGPRVGSRVFRHPHRTSCPTSDPSRTPWVPCLVPDKSRSEVGGRGFGRESGTRRYPSQRDTSGRPGVGSILLRPCGRPMSAGKEEESAPPRVRLDTSALGPTRLGGGRRGPSGTVQRESD